MKKSIFILIVIFVIPAFAQQDRFIIGAEHVSSFGDFTTPSRVPHSPAYWDTVKSLGLNYVGLKYFQQYPVVNPVYGNVPVSQIQAEIDTAGNRNIGVYLYNGFDRFGYNSTDIYYPRRWVYQIENPPNTLDGNNVNDFLNVFKGSATINDNGASTHWNFAPDYSHSAANFLHLPAGISAGVVANTLRVLNLQPDGQNYHLKIRMRLPSAPSYPPPSDDVVSIFLTGTGYGRIIRASEFSDANWKEIEVAQYYKSPLPSDAVSPSPPDTIAYNFTDKYSTVQLPNYSMKLPTPTSYDVQIYYFNTGYDADLDYVAIDDETAERLYGRDFNARVLEFGTEYNTHPALKNLMVWDEPYTENYFPTQYLRTLVAPYRDGLAYRAFSTRADDHTKRFLHETTMPILLSDVYPIVYGLLTPLDANYEAALQPWLDTLVNRLSDLAPTSIQFSRPLWLTVQAHEWADPRTSPPQMSLREPSAYEMRAMANLGVCYGAKGIIYYMYTNNSDTTRYIYRTGLLADDSSSKPEYSDPYGQPKWQTVKDVNHTLGIIGPTLLTLTWQGAKGWHTGAPPPSGTWSNLVTNVSTNFPGETYYVETGHLKYGSSIDYLFVVNRRTLSTEGRDITETLNTLGASWEVSDVASGKIWIVGPNGSFTDTFQPGEGKLYRISPATWSGTKNIVNNVTVPSGAVLNVSAGATIKFQNAMSLTVNGTLNAVGTSGSQITFTSATSPPTPGLWNCVQVQNGGSVFKYCTFQYGVYGLYLYYASSGNRIIIENCNFMYNSNYGLKMTHSNANVKSCQIYSNSTRGVYCYINPDVRFIGTTISQNSNGGVYSSTSNFLQFYGSVIAYNGGDGLVTYGADDIRIGSVYAWWGYNTIYINYGSEVHASSGNPHVSICGSSIHDSNGLEVYNEGNQIIYAQSCYWNSDRYDPSCCQRSGLVTLMPDIYCSLPTWEGQPRTDGSPLGKVSAPTLPDSIPWVLDPRIPDEEKIIRCKDIIAKNSKSAERKEALMNLYSIIRADYVEDHLGEKKGFPDYLQEIKNKSGDTETSRLALRYMIYWKMLENDNAEAVKLSNEALKVMTGEERKLVLVDLAFTYAHSGQIQEAKNVLKELKEKFNLDEELVANIDYDIADVEGQIANGLWKSNQKDEPVKSEPAKPLAAGFSQNYPNPFNPTTTIQYTVTEPCFVTVKIFDVLGREIATLVNEEKSAGFYSMPFDASRLSSGIYFYQVQIGNSRDVKKMLLMK
jgi:hypothetical protein